MGDRLCFAPVNLIYSQLQSGGCCFLIFYCHKKTIVPLYNRKCFFVLPAFLGSAYYLWHKLLSYKIKKRLTNYANRFVVSHCMSHPYFFLIYFIKYEMFIRRIRCLIYSFV